MGINKNQKVQKYIDTVLQQIDCKDAFEEIRVVLDSYIGELIRFYSLEACSEEEIINKAITEMGDPVDFGKKVVWLGTLFTNGF